MKVVVTGASGFLGRECVKLLVAAGADVHAISRREVRSQGGINWHRADILNSGDVRNVIRNERATHLLHLAWVTAHPEYWTSPANQAWSRASALLFEEFAGTGGERIVATGTCAEYDWRAPAPFDEQAPIDPSTLYGREKAALHRTLATLAEDKRIGYAWARLFWLFGPGEQPGRLVPATIRSLLGGSVMLCRSPAAVRDFLYVRDAASALVALLEAEVGGAVNVCSGVGTTNHDLVLEIAASLGTRDLIEFVRGVQDEPPVLVGAPGKLLAATSWVPRYGLRDAMRETVQWWRDQ